MNSNPLGNTPLHRAAPSAADTICAPATALGGALCIVRVSGHNAIGAVSRIFRPASGGDFRDISANHATFGTIVRPADGTVVDEVVATPYAAPHSYTGDDSAEISCHGSPYIVDAIMRLLADAGCRMARPGEFTERAFLAGKMDLSQAEAVADVIAARSEAYSRIAMHQLRGGLRSELTQIHESLLALRSMMELELDFSDHDDLPFEQHSQLIGRAGEIRQRLSRLASSFSSASAIKSGIAVAIVGQPNVGKSTLMNALLGEERAIVSSQPGTTRDTIEEPLSISGIDFRIIDTAGLRDTADEIERQGIERAKAAREKAREILWLVSPERPTLSGSMQREATATDAKTIIVINKADTASPLQIEKIEQTLRDEAGEMGIESAPVVAISAKQKTGLDRLEKLMREACGADAALSSGETVIVSKRHYDALTRAVGHMDCAIRGLEEDKPVELVSLDVRAVDYDLMDIGGQTTPEEVLQNVFSHFCVGK